VTLSYSYVQCIVAIRVYRVEINIILRKANKDLFIDARYRNYIEIRMQLLILILGTLNSF